MKNLTTTQTGYCPTIENPFVFANTTNPKETAIMNRVYDSPDTFNIIGINGVIGSGKDTAATMIQSILNPSEWEIKKFAYKLKSIVSILTGIPLESLEDINIKNSNMSYEWDINGVPQTYRDALQRIGTDALRNIFHKNTWVNALFADLKPSSKWIISDLRFDNEFDAIKNNKGLCIKIIRPTTEPKTPKHESETALTDFPFDYVLYNNGTLDDLRNEVLIMLSHFNLLKK